MNSSFVDQIDNLYSYDIVTITNLLEQYQNDLNSRNKKGQTALTMMARKNYLGGQVWDLLFKYDFDPNFISNVDEDSGFSPLHYAIWYDNINGFNALMKHPKINVNVRHNDGTTPIHCAVTKKNNLYFDRLMEHNPDLNTQGPTGWSVLHRCEHVDKLEKLLKSKTIDVNITEKTGQTPLHFYVGEHHRNATQLISLLLKHSKIDIKIKDHNGMTAHDIAYKEGNAYLF